MKHLLVRPFIFIAILFIFGSCKKELNSNTTPPNSKLIVGTDYQGGKIFYVLVAGDPGYDANTPHGLIAATSDQSTGIQWHNGLNTLTNATGVAMGTGLSNTNAIILSQGNMYTNYAAGIARAYKGGGYDDWYLPSKDELNKLYANREAAFKGHANGGFPASFYWSSTEHTDVNLHVVVWSQSFHNGVQSRSVKGSSSNVRAVRAF
jgi:hypothetical protein